MPKLLSVAKTIASIRDGFPVMEIFGDDERVMDFDQVCLECAVEAEILANRERYDIRGYRLYKDVTRRGGWSKKRGEPAAWKPGWPNAKVGDVVELVEWSPRVGARWVCACGWLGTTKSFRGGDGVDRYPNESPWHLASECPMGGRASVEYRSPRRLGLRRFAEVDLVRLGDITLEDVIREGFPGWTPAQFVDFYCSGKPEPDRIVTRLVLDVVS